MNKINGWFLLGYFTGSFILGGIFAYLSVPYAINALLSGVYGGVGVCIGIKKGWI